MGIDLFSKDGSVSFDSGCLGKAQVCEDKGCTQEWCVCKNERTTSSLWNQTSGFDATHYTQENVGDSGKLVLSPLNSTHTHVFKS